MPIKMYNKTPYKDEPLLALLKMAHSRMRVPGTTVVKVTTQTRNLHASGAMYCNLPFIWHLNRKHCKKDRFEIPKGTDRGWVVIRLPSPKLMVSRENRDIFVDVHALAQRFYEIALHEFAHVKDYRLLGDLDDGPKHSGGRRIRWAKRPCEISAQDQTDTVLKKSLSDRMKKTIMTMALEYFRAKKEQRRKVYGS
jgi:hypothetical protein